MLTHDRLPSGRWERMFKKVRREILKVRPLHLLTLLFLLVAACQPAAAPPAPTAASAAEGPAATSPAAPAASPAAATSPAAKPAASPAAPAAPAVKPAASPAAAASPVAAKPAAKPQFDEQAVANFYSGKTVRIIVGFSPGGGFDIYARMLARHMPQYIPGSPLVIVENKPGAGSLVAANSVYGSEDQDGTVIGSFNESLVLQQALGFEGVQFDGSKFEWLGSATKTTNVCVARTDSGVTSIQDLLGGKDLTVATVGPGSAPHDTAAVLNATLGTNFRLVSGYSGTTDMRRALEAGEVGGFCITFEALTGPFRPIVEGPNPIAKIIIALGAETPEHPLLGGVPAAETLAKTDEAKRLLRAVYAPLEMTKPYALGPGVPKDRVAALRKALADSFADPQFLAEAKQAALDVVPSSGEEVAQIVEGVLSTPPALRAKLKEILE